MDQTKILLVEDDELLRDVYYETLTGEGFKVETAVNGEEAYNKIKLGGWTLVLLDIILPKMDGLAVMKKIKEDPNSNSFFKKLIFLTNLDKDDEIKEALQLGDGYLIKSQLTPEDLLKEVRLYLQMNP